jgi:hypothetical protein
VHSATISLHPSADGGTYAYLDSLGHDIRAVVAAFVQWVIKKKGNQHVGYSRGILAIQQRWLEDRRTLGAAFARQPAIPWWRVYLVERDGVAGLVWNSDKLEDD